jgi:hypothetical protein
MDMVEEFVDQTAEPLEQAKIVANEARNIPNLPQYLDQRLVRLIIDIERIDYVRNSINAVRNNLPDGAVEAEKKSESYGQQPALVS